MLLRMKDDYDGAEPSANSVAADVLLRLAHWTGREDLRESAGKTLRFMAPRITAQPTMAPQLLIALGRDLTPPEQVVIRCADEADARAVSRLSELRKKFSPYSAALMLTDYNTEALRETAATLNAMERTGTVSVYRCRNLACELPEVFV